MCSVILGHTTLYWHLLHDSPTCFVAHINRTLLSFSKQIFWLVLGTRVPSIALIRFKSHLILAKSSSGTGTLRLNVCKKHNKVIKWTYNVICHSPRKCPADILICHCRRSSSGNINPETKRNSAIINLIIYASIFPTVTCQDVLCGEKKFYSHYIST